MMTKISDIPFSHYQPGKFGYLTKESFAIDIWKTLTLPENLVLMIRATQENKPAIHYLLETIETDFGEYLGSKNYPADDVGVFINNMIKQLMKLMGYEHIACGICPTARYIKSSGLYTNQL
jgi:hypothetical protein